MIRPALAGDGHHATSIGVVQRERLFAKDVLARLQTLDRKRSVESVRSDVANGVDIRTRKHIFQAGVSCRNSVLLAESVGTSLVHIYCSQNLAIGNLLKSLGVKVGHASCAENGKTDDSFRFAHEKDDSNYL